MEALITNLASGKRRTYIVIIVIFTISVLFSGNFECTCKSQVSDCSIYMFLPSIIIFLLMLWTSNSFQRVSRFTCDGTCGSKCCRFCGSFLRRFLKASLVSVLWAAYLFFSGDWYVCCMSHLSNRTEEVQLPCKDKWKLTIEERLRITELNNESRVSGIFFLFHMFEPVILTQQYECILCFFFRELATFCSCLSMEQQHWYH